MTLYTTDYLEYYLTLVAWVVNNGIWSILVASGVFALPFVAIVVQEWLRARAEGADEGNKGVLSSMRIENRVWVAIVVILFAGVPFIPVSRHDQVRHHALRAMPGQCPAAQRHGLVQRLHGAQRPERAGAGVVVLHARAVESRDGLRGGGDSLRHGPASD